MDQPIREQPPYKGHCMAMAPIYIDIILVLTIIVIRTSHHAEDSLPRKDKIKPCTLPKCPLFMSEAPLHVYGDYYSYNNINTFNYCYISFLYYMKGYTLQKQCRQYYLVGCSITGPALIAPPPGYTWISSRMQDEICTLNADIYTCFDRELLSWMHVWLYIPCMKQHVSHGIIVMLILTGLTRPIIIHPIWCYDKAHSAG